MPTNRNIIILIRQKQKNGGRIAVMQMAKPYGTDIGATPSPAPTTYTA
jgi:hypothetical protein